MDRCVSWGGGPYIYICIHICLFNYLSIYLDNECRFECQTGNTGTTNLSTR